MEPIPDDVRQFLVANIDSLEQLETLRLLGQDPQREWLSSELATHIQTTPESTIAHLAALETRGLLKCIHEQGRIVVRFGSKSNELDQQILRLLDLYRQRPVTMIRLVYERAGNPLRDFAEAFKLRKEK